ncbi:MAG TPA: hypothetical protein P5110_01530 [Candidatus Omnitrophota bacterium]|nr:hypothetical protein [Candidatus Omnitrophota bacterium]HRZ14168.1 hypothetical protein [Candidatus Omnitrophota bacterium]
MRMRTVVLALVGLCCVPGRAQAGGPAAAEQAEVSVDCDRSMRGLPDVRDVQQAAIRFADVDMGKITRWRRQAAKRAWLPQVRLGLDRDASELWHWEGGSTTKDGDDILRKGRDALGWDISFTWDMGDLVWSSDQTSIDTRSRLLVILREDVLEQVTKLYFEYVRAVIERAEAEGKDERKASQKELRLKELAAYLDALTGGYFSSHLR